MRFVKFALTAVLFAVISSNISAYDGIDGEFAPNVYTPSWNTLGDIQGEFTPNVRRNSWNALGDIKGEFVPNLRDPRPNASNDNAAPTWLDELDWLLGY